MKINSDDTKELKRALYEMKIQLEDSKQNLKDANRLIDKALKKLNYKPSIWDRLTRKTSTR